MRLNEPWVQLFIANSLLWMLFNLNACQIPPRKNQRVGRAGESHWKRLAVFPSSVFVKTVGSVCFTGYISLSASPYQHSDHHYQQSVGYTQSSHLSFSFFCFEKPKPDTGWQPLLFTQLEGHGRLFREHDTAYWAAIWRTAGPPHQPALSTSVKTPNPTEYQIHRPIFKQSEVHMMIWVRDWGIEPGDWARELKLTFCWGRDGGVEERPPG